MKNRMAYMIRQFFRRAMLVMVCGVFVVSAAYGQVLKGSAPALTNQDVVRMVKAGVPESAVIASIDTRPAKFDVSPDALIELKRAGVSQNVIQAMLTRGNNPGSNPKATVTGMNDGGKNRDDLNPQPYPPKGKTNAPASVAQLSARLAPISRNIRFVTGSDVKNPAALASPMISILRQQTQGGNIAPGQTLSAAGSGGGSPTPAGRATSTAALTARPMLSAPAAMQPNSSGPTRQQPAGGSRPTSGSNRYGTLSANTANVCLNATGIRAINGKKSGVVFTPDLQFNHYIITGCGFGTTPGQIFLSGGFPAHGGKVPLVPYHAFGTPNTPGWGAHWTDQQIEAEIDTNIAGELDQNNINLVIQTSNGGQAQANGNSFYALRGTPFLVSQMPTSAFCETHTTNAVSCTEPGYTAGGALLSPCGQWGLSNCTSEILRTQPFVIASNPAIDQYTMNLKPGFTLYSAAVQIAVELHSSSSPTSIAQIYQPKISGNTIFVREPVEVDSATGFTYSLYGLRIFVVGPVGVTSPWAGQ